MYHRVYNKKPDILVGKSTVTEDLFDEFAMACGATYQATIRHARVTAALEQGVFRIQRFDIWTSDELGTKKKIGQFLITKGSRNLKFHPGICLLQGHEHLWSEAMRMALEALGDGRYIYGARFNLEDPREDKIKCIRGAYIIEVHDHVVEAVDFSQWPTWNHYVKNISNNIRRNIKYFADNTQDYDIEIKTGIQFIRHIPSLVFSRYKMYRRKSVKCSPYDMVRMYLTRLLSSGSNSYSARLQINKSNKATFSGIQFGALDFYMDGASDDNVRGCGSFLVLEMLARFFNRSPNGKFVLGSDPNPIRDQDSKYTTRHRYRQDLIISYFPTSTVEFYYKYPID